jgi:hypothetical protein
LEIKRKATNVCIFHKYISVEDADHVICRHCFRMPSEMSKELAKKYPKGYCPHSFKVCIKCGNPVGYGSHGKLSLVPDGCKEQINSMRKKEEKKP